MISTINFSKFNTKIINLQNLIGYTIIGYLSMSEFIVINNCTCNGYECRITGNGSTIWQGTGTTVGCSSSSNEIILFHGQSSSSMCHVCNSGAVMGCITSVENNSYITQLMVSVSAEVIGTNISCSHDHGGHTDLIGSSLITLTTGRST